MGSPRRIPGVLGTLVLGACVLFAAGICVPTCLQAARKDALPWSVEVQVRWGIKKNREIYRGNFERAILADLISKACFERVVGEGETGETDLILEIQLNELMTEQEFDSPQTIFPGQGEQHTLRSARATVDLDFWLHPHGDDAAEIVSGHLFRAAVREPQTPTDAPEERALRDLTKDASHWVVRDLCDRRGRLLDKVTRALGSPKR